MKKILFPIQQIILFIQLILIYILEQLVGDMNGLVEHLLILLIKKVQIHYAILF